MPYLSRIPVYAAPEHSPHCEMPAKKPAAKKESARDGPVEPEHDPRWEQARPISRHTPPCLACRTCHTGSCVQAVASGVLDFSPADLPDANTWPTHGALRERLLLACCTVELPGCHAARDAFLAELVRLAPPELARLVRHDTPFRLRPA